MRVVIVGCGRAGAELAHRLDRAGHEVTIVDEAGSAFGKVHPDFRGRTLQGNVLSRDTLERAGLEGADGFAAMTNSDTVNAVAAHVARSVFQVPNVVVRNYATGWLPLHAAFGHEVVSSTTWGAQRVETLMLQGAVRSVCSAGNGEVAVYEVRVTKAWAGKALEEMLPPGCRAVAVTRAGRALLATDDLRLEAEDGLLVGATVGGLAALRDRLEIRDEIGERVSKEGPCS
jgi:trk system potassium uptake protein TrkA